jgi:hypothetical protein
MANSPLWLIALVWGGAVTASDVTGDWNLSLKADGIQIPPLTCALEQKGQQLAGTCKADGDPEGRSVQLTGGRIENGNVQFAWKVDTPDGEVWTYTLTGRVDEKATTMDGGFKVASRAGGGEGTFMAKKR